MSYLGVWPLEANFTWVRIYYISLDMSLGHSMP